jgi:ankyrin repeat protein
MTRTALFLSILAPLLCWAQVLDDNLRRAGFTEMHAAAWNDDVKAIEAIAKRGVSVNVAAESGITPLHSAAMKGKVRAIKALLALGADIEARDQFGRTPLFIAAEVNPNPASALMELMASGAALGAKDKWGKTPLDAAWTDEARKVLRRPTAGIDSKISR